MPIIFMAWIKVLGWEVVNGHNIKNWMGIIASREWARAHDGGCAFKEEDGERFF